jgi:hypothetical protein
MLVGQTGSLLVRAALLSIISHEFLITESFFLQF